jgi:peptidoglycan/LPS O-acetylase OafA/YrhL
VQCRFSKPEYRPDIDGLRAIAVLAVVIFHCFPHVLRGGFIGVDVFFVISGFLITTLIFQNLDKGTFSFIDFYSRRIVRLFPALILILLSSYALGWFILFTDEYKQFGKHIAAGAGFVSNFIFWGEAGYFDNLKVTKPLLHLWSLAIEEQFYIVWPLLLWMLRKYKLAFIMALTVLSFIFNIKISFEDSVAAFYSPFTRIWELSAGALLAWFFLYKKKTTEHPNTLSWLGVVFFIYGFIQIDESKNFPGAWALIPVIGAVCIIWAGPKAWFNRIILSNKVMVWIGLISFPLYLWHWPLFSLVRIVSSDTPSVLASTIVIILSVLFSWATYYFIERPLRQYRFIKTKAIILTLLMAGTGYIGYYTYSNNGLDFRHVLHLNASLDSGNDGSFQVPLDENCGLDEEVQKKFSICEQDTRRPIKYVLLGDSKAASMWSGLVRTSHYGSRWRFIGGHGDYGSIVPVISENELYRGHRSLSRIAIESVAKNNEIKAVVFVVAKSSIFQLSIAKHIGEQNYKAAFKGLKASIETLTSNGKHVVIVIDNPTLPRPEDCLMRSTDIDVLNRLLVKRNLKCEVTIEEHLERTKKYRELLSEMKTIFPSHFHIFDTTKFYCDEATRLCGHKDQSTGRYLYSYSDHVSDFAAGLVGRELNQFLYSL